ncbi:MAG: hypothetical protein HC927_01255 [Deltaproteobacteria bacterium]|nr:hypothetical protein [Deltaproteobacteria bacterium]
MMNQNAMNTASQMAQYGYGAGNQLAGIYGNLGSQQGAAHLGTGSQLANMQMQGAQGMAGTYAGPVEFAGGELAAYGNMFGNFGEMASQYGQAGMEAAGKVAGGAGGAPSL